MNPLVSLAKSLSDIHSAESVSELDLGLGWLDEQGKFVAFQGDLSERLPIIWVPTQQVLLLSVKVPGKRMHQWQQALPYALEDQLAEPVEQLHFAIYHREADGTTYCAVVNRQKMQQWVDEITAQGYPQAMLLPDIFQLPEAERATDATLVQSSQAVTTEKTTKEPAETPQNVQNPQPRLAKTAWRYFQGADEGQKVVIWVRQGTWLGFATYGHLWPLLQQKSQQSPCPILLEDLRQYWQNKWPSGKAAVKHFAKWDLRQGAFRIQGAAIGAGEGKWRLPAALGGAILILYWLGLSVDTHYMKQQAALYQQQTVALFQQLFPEVKRLVNLKVQTRQQLQALQQGHQPTLKPIQFLKHTQELWLNASQVKLQQLKWQDQRWILQVQAERLAEVNRLVHALQKQAKHQGVKVQFKVDQVTQGQVTGKIYVE